MNDAFMAGNCHQEFEVKQVPQAEIHVTVLYMLAGRTHCLTGTRKKEITKWKCRRKISQTFTYFRPGSVSPYSSK